MNAYRAGNFRFALNVLESEAEKGVACETLHNVYSRLQIPAQTRMPRTIQVSIYG